MKPIGLLALFLITGIVHSQSEVLFKVSFAPNSTYTSVTTTEVKSLMNFEADDETLEKLKRNGMDLPLEMVQHSEISVISETGTLDSNKNLPILIYYDKMKSYSTVNGNPTPRNENPFAGVTIHAHITPENKTVLDSLGGKKIDEPVADMLKSTIDQVLNTIDFPDKPIHIGEHFSNQVPLSIPIGNQPPMNMFIDLEYHLKSIDNDMASFDVTQNVSLSMEQQNIDFKAEGKGLGVLLFDIEKGITSRYETDLPMKLVANLPGDIKMIMNMESKTVVTTTINP